MASRNKTILYGLGGRIRDTREQHGLSLTDMSVAVGSDKSALSKIEKGERVPNLETIGRLADELDVPLTVWFLETACVFINDLVQRVPTSAQECEYIRLLRCIWLCPNPSFIVFGFSKRINHFISAQRKE